MSPSDRALLRDLARQVAEIASLPVMAERRAMWERHNALQRVRPMILVFPEGSWGELLPRDVCGCEDEAARRIEWELRRRIYHHAHLHDDTVIEKTWVVHKAIRSTGWGIESRQVPATEDRGAWKFDPVILSPEDLEKLRFPEITHDEAATAGALAEARDLFGYILDGQLKGVAHIGFHPMSGYTRLRGLEEVMMDMVLQPAMLHDAMAFLEDGYRRMTQQYVDQNLLSLNNDGTYHSSGGNGYTDELPQPDAAADRVRPCDMWASAEAQELAQVSPAMHEEFALQYERRLLEPFGLNGYGCCEDLTDKLDLVLTIPNIRRISISPWADVDRCGERLGADCIFSWKPHPSHLVGRFDEDRVREYITRCCDATRGGVVEMILKDTHTCERRPERFTMWTDIAQDVATRY